MTVAGSGFASADSQVTLSNPADSSLAVCALSSGTISGACSFVADSVNGFSFSSGGSAVVVTATGNAAGDTQTATFTGTVLSLTLNPSQGPSGVTVTVRASGFASTDPSIQVDGPTSDSLCTITVSPAGSGSGSCSFQSSSGNGFTFSLSGTSNSVTATGSIAGDVQIATFTGTTPAITVTPGQGPVGATVTVAGTGFPVNTALSSLLFDGAAISSCASGSMTADGTGRLSCQFRVPAGTSGTSVEATASTGQIVPATFTVTTPMITLSPQQGPTGSDVTVAGTGYSVDVTLKSLVFDGVAITSCVSGSLATTATGSFDCQFTVPAGTSGTSVVATDPGETTASGTFTVTIPSFSVAPTSGPSGATVTASGSGFTVSSNIQFTIGNGGVISSPTACTTSPSGTFSGCAFTVNGPVGSYTLTATDSSHSTATTAYSIVFLYTLTFSESGLPNGTTWTVTVGGHAENSTNSTISFQLQNGTYTYVITDVSGWHQISLAYSSSVTVKGSSVTEPTLQFTRVTYQVTFSETGLPVGTTWWVNLSNGQSREGTGGSTIIFLEPNGSYDYSASAAPDSYAAPGGTFDVNAMPLSLTVRFSSTYYPVTFSETGLPTGVRWWVNLTGGPSGSSTTSTLTLSLVNGTWLYVVAAANPTYRAPSGTFTVSGAARTVSIAFSAYYAVTFIESGLPSGTSWQVTMDGVTQTAIAGISIVFSVPNGSYAYQVGDVSGWHQNTIPYRGTVTISGGGVMYPTLAFVQVRYSVTFFESGLPAGTSWFVNITNGTSSHAMGSTIVLFLPNGTFDYRVSSPGFFASPGSGAFAVSGGPSVVSITFTLAKYAVTFTESGLPSGTSWTLALNGVNQTSTNSTIAFEEVNGTYSFLVHSSNPQYHAPGGTFSVSGNTVDVFVSFSLTNYQVTFTETGLPSGTGWSITLNGTTNRSTSIVITFASSNGTYAFSIGAVPGYVASPSSGTVQVFGTAVSIVIRFSIPEYSVVFKETGLPTGTFWTVTLNGTNRSSDSVNITFTLANGTYAYLIGSLAYVAEPSSGTVAVSGDERTVSVQFLPGYSVTINRPGGLPNGTLWNATLTGEALSAAALGSDTHAVFPVNETRSSTAQTITFLEPAGNYTWQVTVYGHSGYLAQGTVAPSPANPHPNVVPPPVGGGGSGGFGTFGAFFLAALPYIALAVAGALVLFGLFLALASRRKKAREAPSTEYFEAYLPTATQPAVTVPVLFEGYTPAEEAPFTPPLSEAPSRATASQYLEPWEPGPEPGSSAKSGEETAAPVLHDTGSKGSPSSRAGTPEEPPKPSAGPSAQSPNNSKKGPVDDSTLVDWTPDEE